VAEYGPKNCYVYVLGVVDESPDGSGEKSSPRTYVGWTMDLPGRLAQHNDGRGAKSTRGRRWRLLYAERFTTRGAAMSREWHLKRDRKFRKSLALASVIDSIIDEVPSP
jgi:putative endonuclease